MEDALRARKRGLTSKKLAEVLILILMEDALRVIIFRLCIVGKSHQS